MLVIHRERLAPVALAGEDGVAQAVVHLHAAYLVLLHIFLRGFYRFLHGHPVQREVNIWLHAGTRTVHHDAFFRVVALLAHVGAFHQRNDRQVEMTGERIVAGVMGRHRHDGTGSVAGKHIVAHPYRVLLTSERVDGIAAGKHTGHFLVDHALTLRARLHLLKIGFNLFLLPSGSQLAHQLTLRSQHHEGHTEHRVGTGGEYRELFIAVCHLEHNLGTLASSYPVALGFFQRVGPVYRVQSVEQTL